MTTALYSAAEVTELIEHGQILLVTGDRRLLGQLPTGHWIGGSDPYVLADGVPTDRLAVTRLTDEVT